MNADKDLTLYNCSLQYTAHSCCWPHHSRTSHFVSDFTFLVFRISFSLAYFLPALQKNYPVKHIAHTHFNTFHSLILLIACISECTLHSEHGVQLLTKLYFWKYVTFDKDFVLKCCLLLLGSYFPGCTLQRQMMSFVPISSAAPPITTTACSSVVYTVQ